jgi:hypothetical protein
MLDLLNKTIFLLMFVPGQKFRENEPFPHIVAEPFFKPDFAKKLLKSFPSFNPEKAKNEMRLVGGKAVHQDVRGLGMPFRHLDDYKNLEAFIIN